MAFCELKGARHAKKKNLVGISFDDGPNPDNVEEILDILDETQARGTFFWIVENARRLKQSDRPLFEYIVAKMKSGGHEVGLHAPSDYKPNLRTMAVGKWSKSEMLRAKIDLEDLIGDQVSLYRPHILVQPMTMWHANQLGLRTVLSEPWVFAKADAPVERQVRVFGRARAGSVLIFHDGVSMFRQVTHVVEVLPQVLQNLKGKDYYAVKLSEVL